MNVRKEIRSLPPDELRNIRKAYAALQAETVRENYQYHAGLHGLPNPSNCPHHLPEFLPWHRLYILSFEEALRRHVPNVTLPYWDWASSDSQTSGLPVALTEESWTDESGGDHPNPLRQAQVAFQSRSTSRAPSQPRWLGSLANQVEQAMRQTVFYDFGESNDFSSALEMPHDSLHGWVRGDMGSVEYSAFDPIFWMHHCNIDRLWAGWQMAHPNVAIPSDLLSRSLAVYEKTIESTLDFKKLGFTYDNLEVAPVPRMAPMTVAGFVELSPLLPSPPRTSLVIRGLKMTKETFELRVFLDQQDATASTDRFENPHFAGSVTLLGMGGAMNPRGFKGTFRRALDISSSVDALGAMPSKVKFVVVDVAGKEVPVEQLKMDIEISID